MTQPQRQEKLIPNDLALGQTSWSIYQITRDSTMRKNLPKTLDHLIFCKYTLVFSKCSQIY